MERCPAVEIEIFVYILKIELKTFYGFHYFFDAFTVYYSFLLGKLPKQFLFVAITTLTTSN